MQFSGYGLPRICFLGTWVNKDEKGSRGQEIVRKCAIKWPRRPRSSCGAFLPAPNSA
jgi:hypothetical protein